MSVTKYALLRCIMCGYPHAVNASFADGRSCTKCGGHLSYEGPITVLAPPESALIKEVKRVMPVGIEVDDKQLDVALGKALRLESALESCRKKAAKLVMGLHVYEEDLDERM